MLSSSHDLPLADIIHQMKYRYEDLSPEQFENLVIAICRHILGIATQKFSTGPDGGRDAKFVGVAEMFPSRSAPWNGTVIIQAKHTNGYNKKFSESDFFSKTGTNTVIAEETPRIRRLREGKKLDYYMLFSNRRLSGNIESEICEYISKNGYVPQERIYLCGVENLEDFVKHFPDTVAVAGLDPVDAPLMVSPDDLATVVQALARQRASIRDILDIPPMPRVPYEEKNELNNMTPPYAKEQRRRYLKDTVEIHSFLAAPMNLDLQRLYESVVEEFQLRIIAKRKEYQTFDSVMEYLIGLLFDRDVDLSRNKRLTRAMLFYMYWNCDIGESTDVETH